MKSKKDYIKRIVCILIGSFISTIGVNSFIIPHKFLSGGVTGISLIIHYLTNTPTSKLILLINLPIFLIGLKKIDKDFIIFSLIGMFSFSFFMNITKDFSTYLSVNNLLLSSIYAGVLNGISGGIVFNNRASTGGADVIAVILKKKFDIKVSSILLGINAVIVAIGSFINGTEIALYTLVSMYISSCVLDRVVQGLNRKKMLFIITNKEEEITNAILEELGRGVTYFNGQGAYTGEDKKILYCIVEMNELAKLKKIVEDIDSKSFISVMDASEVHGRGFKKALV